MCAVTGLVLAAAAGDPGAVHQHLAGHHVLQAADVAAASGARARACLHPRPFVNTCHFSNKYSLNFDVR